MKNPIIITLEMFHDPYETDHGDGYYPHIIHSDGMASTTVKFILTPDHKSWLQMRYYENYIRGIDGLDGDIGTELLALLNKQANITSAIDIYNSYGRILYPKKI